MGGDEFVVIVEPQDRDGDDPTTPHDDHRLAVHIAQRITRAVGAPVVVDGHGHHVTASIGLSFTGGHPVADRETAGRLLREADTAMYQAKEQGKDRYVVYGELPGGQSRRLAPVGSNLQTPPPAGQIQLPVPRSRAHRT